MSAYRQLEQIQQQLAQVEASPAGPVTISIGIASFPAHADCADELQRRADGALYWSKQHGKNRSCLYSPSLVRIYSPDELERETERNARLRAAKNLVRFVDARDPSTANHSQVVSALAEAIGVQLDLDPETVSHLQLAGLLHDLGKIGLADSILKAPRKLTEEEFAIVKRHPEFGHSLLDGLGIEPVEDWVLHHHEHWDGSGYPHGLSGEEIPLGARIVLVADAFEAMTADRPYRQAQSREAALAGCATRPARNSTQRSSPPSSGTSQLRKRSSSRRSPDGPRAAASRHACGGAAFRRALEPAGRAAPPLACSLLHRIRASADRVPGLRTALADARPHRRRGVAYSLFALGAARNLRVAGVALVSVGMASNVAAIISNGGHMPALPAALRAAGLHFEQSRNSIAAPEPHLSWLVDRWAAQTWVPWANVFSVGDVAIALGGVVFALAATGALRMPSVAFRQRRTA
jgi:hypothetical protein